MILLIIIWSIRQDRVWSPSLSTGRGNGRRIGALWELKSTLGNAVKKEAKWGVRDSCVQPISSKVRKLLVLGSSVEYTDNTHKHTQKHTNRFFITPRAWNTKQGKTLAIRETWYLLFFIYFLKFSFQCRRGWSHCLSTVFSYLSAV